MTSIEPNILNGGVNKPPPYPVEGAKMIQDPPAPDPHTADLVPAVQYGYYDRVFELIEAEPYLATKPLDDNVTLLHWAAINDRIDIAKYLINKRVQIDVCGGELNSTPLHWAIRDGKLQMVVFLLAHQAQPSLFDGEGYSSVHLASIFGHTDILAYLIAKGQDVDLLDKHGMTPLMHATQKVKNRDPTQLLIRLGAEINFQNSTNKFTALHYAITGSNREAIQLLLDAGAKTDIRNSDNETAYDLISRWPVNRHLVSYFSSSDRPSNKYVPKWLHLKKSHRRFGTKFLPYLIIIIIPLILQLQLSLLYKIFLFIALLFSTRGYTMIFFDKNIDRYLPISIAQASIFWLYVCYFYYILPYVHIISFSFFGLVICTYFSWTNYYLAQKRDPGTIISNREEQYRNIIELVEDDLFDYETFCTCCLIKRPMRSKHCRECGKCISKFDHHCPWVDNCVGDKNLRYFTGFLFFTPLCICFNMHGAYLYYRDHCHLFSSDTFFAGLLQVLNCTPAVLWFTSLATLHLIWISCLCITILFQIGAGYTTNEKLNAWRYRYLKSKKSNPFSLGVIQNFVDLLNRRVLWYKPTYIDWTKIYSLEDFYRSIPIRTRQRLNLPAINNSEIELLNV